jgi:hypothetical protein
LLNVNERGLCVARLYYGKKAHGCGGLVFRRGTMSGVVDNGGDGQVRNLAAVHVWR